MLTALALLFATIASAGDTLSVKGGDTLHGQLVDIREGIVTFKADLAGKVLVPVDEVVAINVELPVELTLTGSAPVRGFLSTKESTILFQTGDEPAKPIHLAEVALLRPVR